jgi:hypothetical protein
VIGVDGGATEVKAHEIVEVGGGLEIGPAAAVFRYAENTGFAPIALAAQLVEFRRGDVRVTLREKAEGAQWIDTAAQAIGSVAARTSRARLVIGMCMPGLKTSDGRGVAVMKNGPRIPDYVDQLEARLARDGFVLAQPIGRLISDGDACGHGEDASAHGGFRGVANAYYVGGGTGLAECCKLDGRVVGFDALSGVLSKGWEMQSERGGHSFEELLSMRGINARFRERGGGEEWVEIRAAAGDAQANDVLSEAAIALGEIAALRVSALRASRGTRLERVVVGQRLGRLFADPKLAHVLRDAAESELERRAGVRGLFVASTLRAAPAIGSARCALGMSAARGEAHG